MTRVQRHLSHIGHPRTARTPAAASTITSHRPATATAPASRDLAAAVKVCPSFRRCLYDDDDDDME